MKRSIIILCLMIFAAGAPAQQFEESGKSSGNFEKPEVKVGADFALQLQFLKHHADSALIPLGNGLNLPTANLNLDAVIADGISVDLTTYLSSRHHPETWVKGGYILFDKLPFIKSKAITAAMNYLDLKAGVMEINYGDAHFRRSDNGNVLNNRFVGNYIMDAFTTAPALEINFRDKGVLLMAGLTSGTLDPVLAGYNAAARTYTPYKIADELAFYWKAGYDKQVSNDFRLRATLSGYHSANNHRGSLYFGDRTGSRYYLVMNPVTYSASDVDPSSNHLSGNWGPGFMDKDNSFMLNLFTRYKGLEFFETVENANGTSPFGGARLRFTQYATEGIYHFGKDDRYYGGVRINYVDNNTTASVFRVQAGAGVYLTPRLLIKAEYVNQNYSNFSQYGSNAGFKGLMLESTVSF